MTEKECSDRYIDIGSEGGGFFTREKRAISRQRRKTDQCSPRARKKAVQVIGGVYVWKSSTIQCLGGGTQKKKKQTKGGRENCLQRKPEMGRWFANTNPAEC